jgi:hypothetical protein
MSWPKANQILSSQWPYSAHNIISAKTLMFQRQGLLPALSFMLNQNRAMHNYNVQLSYMIKSETPNNKKLDYKHSGMRGEISLQSPFSYVTKPFQSQTATDYRAQHAGHIHPAISCSTSATPQSNISVLCLRLWESFRLNHQPHILRATYQSSLSAGELSLGSFSITQGATILLLEHHDKAGHLHPAC